ncbi:MAG: tetratricopeptide repeat protein [Sulfuricella sp.]|nr:tetratricopeptide repeat protein [Sulfuricella sp.]
MSRFRIAATLTILSCTMFMAVAQPVYADELQEINKLYKQGQNGKALERLESFLTSRPKDAQGPKIAQGRFLKGLILAELGKNAEAIQVFTKLTEEYPELPEPYNNLAVLYASQGQYDKARHALEMAISTHPSYATAHENLGDIYAKMASQAYDKALQLDKSNATAQTKLALVKELFSVTSKANRAPVPAPSSSGAEPTKPVPVPAPVTSKPVPEAKPAPEIKEVKPTPEAKPAPEAKSAPAPTEQGSKSDTQAAVLKTLHGWAKAWSGKNVGAYLAYYARDFKTPGGENRTAWEKSRKERIGKPKSIHVSIESPRVSLIDTGHVSVTFRQAYKSDALSTSTQKTVVLVKTGDKWLIQQERIGR